jgi:hypothetical protein
MELISFNIIHISNNKKLIIYFHEYILYMIHFQVSYTSKLIITHSNKFF